MLTNFHLVLLVAVGESSLLPVIAISAVILLLFVGSAVVSASEVSFFSIGPTELSELEKLPSRSAKIAVGMLNKPKELLATIVIANNFFNFGIIILGAFLSSLIFPAPVSGELEKFLADILVITFTILLFGEVIPKIYATRNGKRVLLLSALPIYYFGKLPPFSWFARLLVAGTSRMKDHAGNTEPEITSTELSHALELTIEEETDEQDQKILEGIVRFGKKDVKQVMRPRSEVEALDISANYQTVYRRIVAAGFSRMPVCRGSFDVVAGVLFVKDLLPHLDEQENFNWQQLIRPAFFVPESRKIDDLLKDFQGRNVHMAIVVNEYGGTTGIITLEDVLEEIVGEIADEFDDEGISYSRLDAFNFVFDGKTLLKEVHGVMDIDPREWEPAKIEADNLGGFVAGLAGRLPKTGERVTFGNYRFTVESADVRKVNRVKVTKLAPGSDENE
jgi:putative hemolysin